MIHPESQLNDALQKAAITQERLKHMDVLINKGLPTEDPEAGVHLHMLTRELLRTKLDARHIHIFHIVIDDMDFLFATDIDGAHDHPLKRSDSNKIVPSGKHPHIVHLPTFLREKFAVEFIITDRDGDHQHETQVFSTTLDGIHQHKMKMPDGKVLTSLLPGDFWALMGGMPQDGLPPAPPATLFAQLSDAAWDALNGGMPSSPADVAMAEKALRSGDVAQITDVALQGKMPPLVWSADLPIGSLPAVKVLDPAFLIDRLMDGEDASLAYAEPHESRVGKAQLLLNSVSQDGYSIPMAWGIVAPGAPTEVSEDDKREDIDPSQQQTTQKLFRNQLQIIAVFDPPLAVRNVPDGTVFCDPVDLIEDLGEGVDVISKKIERRGKKHCVIGEKSGKNFGCYDTRAKAEARLAQIERFGNKKGVHTDDDKKKKKKRKPYQANDPAPEGTEPPPAAAGSEEDLSVGDDDAGTGGGDESTASAELIAKAERVIKLVNSAEEEEERIVFGVVLVPNEVDAQGDIYSKADVRKACYSFMETNAGQVKLMHDGEAMGQRVVILENYVSKQTEIHNAHAFPEGTWFATSRVNDDDIWADVKKGVFTGYSIGGSAIKEELA